ncbi:NRDE family protein [Legionella saoudiensis]|uniref:NRDE family protein n=1 Tax=Legionella saoudiensis TaxID=1750561 RepID=UPI00073008E8|nr:NRDE family protein [Legionella saoudiensis]
MCLALIVIEQHPLYPLMILSNRDEFYNRATAPAHYWDEAPGVFAGKDLVSGGTWLGVNTQGRFSLITNYRDPSHYNPERLSRGLLAKNYLLKNAPAPRDYIHEIAPTAENYNGFNLLVGTMRELIYFSNIENKIKKLKPGIYGLSNHLLDTPSYKVLKAKEMFQEIAPMLLSVQTPKEIYTLLFPILENHQHAPEDLLPQTGVPLEFERALSPISVNIPSRQYGTRCSSIVLFSKDTTFFAERIIENAHAKATNSTFIKIQKSA